MRILIVDTYYPAFLEAHYAAAPHLAGAPYAEQWRALMDRFFGTADSYSCHLGPLGHVASEVVYNCEPLQRAWRSERPGRPFGRRRSSPDAILLDQVEELGADVVYVQDLWALEPRTLRRLGRGRLLVGQIASELPHTDQLKPYDLIVTSFPHYAQELPRRGLPAAFLPLAFDERVLERMPSAASRSGAVFVGSLHPVRHRGGSAVLAYAVERAPIALYGTGAEEWPPGSAVAARYRGEAWGLDMYAVFARAAISVNRHIDAAGRYANNMRLFESTGAGALLVTDAKDNLHELFEAGVEVVTYETADELVEQVRHYLAHEDDRAAIAAAGQRRTMRDHTWAVRMRELAAILEGWR